MHWGSHGWHNASDVLTCNSGLGFHVAVLDAGSLSPGDRVEFTWQWQNTGAWDGRDYEVAVLSADQV